MSVASRRSRQVVMLYSSLVLLFSLLILGASADKKVVPADQKFSVEFQSFEDSSAAPGQYTLHVQLQQAMQFWLGDNKTIAVIHFDNYTKICDPRCTPYAIFHFVNDSAKYFANTLANEPYDRVIDNLPISKFAVGTSVFRNHDTSDNPSGGKIRALTIGLIVGVLVSTFVFVGTFFCVKYRVSRTRTKGRSGVEHDYSVPLEDGGNDYLHA